MLKNAPSWERAHALAVRLMLITAVLIIASGV
jgi:hypothetical protein